MHFKWELQIDKSGHAWNFFQRKHYVLEILCVSQRYSHWYQNFCQLTDALRIKLLTTTAFLTAIWKSFSEKSSLKFSFLQQWKSLTICKIVLIVLNGLKCFRKFLKLKFWSGRYSKNFIGIRSIFLKIQKSKQLRNVCNTHHTKIDPLDQQIDFSTSKITVCWWRDLSILHSWITIQ